VKPLDAVEVCLRVRNLLETRRLYREQRAAREAAEAAEHRALLLAEASRVLSSSLDRVTTVGQLAPLLVPEFADACVVRVIQDGRWSSAGIASSNPVLERSIQLMLDDGFPDEEGSPVSAAVGVDDRLEERLSELLGEGVGPVAILRAPLLAGSKTVGTITVARVPPRRAFDPVEQALVGELAARAGVAVENARLVATAQRAVHARDRVLSVVAHDLRNPLASIAANAEMLRNLFPPNTPGHQRQAVARIERVAQQTHSLVQDLLDISRVDDRTLGIAPRVVPVGELLEEAEVMLRPLAITRSVDLEFSADDISQTVVVDDVIIIQVMSNLVGNALRFTPAGGRVRVIGRKEEDEYVVAVEDNGSGIPADRVPRLFGGPWNADPSDWQGAGLGLVIARAIVEAHGGRIWLESPPGAGATFSFSLRIASRAEVS